MASQMIDTILSAEKECDKRIQAANEKAAEIRGEAARQQAEIFAQAREEAAQMRKRILDEAAKEAAQIQAESDLKAAQNAHELKDSVRRRSGAATDAVGSLLLQLS